MWIFRKKYTNDGYRVGFYDPEGDFISVYTFIEIEDAESKVHYLNGGNN